MFVYALDREAVWSSTFVLLLHIALHLPSVSLVATCSSQKETGNSESKQLLLSPTELEALRKIPPPTACTCRVATRTLLPDTRHLPHPCTHSIWLYLRYTYVAVYHAPWALDRVLGLF